MALESIRQHRPGMSLHAHCQLVHLYIELFNDVSESHVVIGGTVAVLIISPVPSPDSTFY